MMQNLPFLVAKANHTKSATESMSSKQSSEQGGSFQQVLSQQVEEEAIKTPLDKASSNKAKDEKHSNVSENEQVAAVMVDAQLLASAVTAKTVQEVTEGEVILGSAQEADVTQLPLANFTASLQTITAQNPTKTTSEHKLDVALAQTHVAADSETEVDVETDLTKGKIQADASAEKNGLDNSKLINPILTEKRTQSLQDVTVSQAVSSVTDATSISAMALQTGAKLGAQSSPLAGQVGFSNAIHAAPGKSGWNDAIGQKVVWMVGAAEQSATLTLNPKDLGPLQVIIHVNNEKADATFISENPEVRKALEEGMSHLRNLMGQAGVELGQANVNTNKQQQEFQQASKEYAEKQANGDSMPQDVDHAGNVQSNMRVSHGLVDTFV